MIICVPTTQLSRTLPTDTFETHTCHSLIRSSSFLLWATTILNFALIISYFPLAFYYLLYIYP